MNKTFNQLWDEYDTLSQNGVNDIIDFYETNSTSIAEIDIDKSEEHYHGKLRFEMQYGLNLVDKGIYSKGCAVLKNAIPMYEFAPDIDRNNFENDIVFERLLWNYGIALYETGHLKESINIFNRLVYFYPENDKYKKWYVQLKTQKLSKISDVALVVGSLLLLFGILNLDNKFNLGFIYPICLFITFLVLISTWLFKFLIKRGKLGNTPHNKK